MLRLKKEKVDFLISHIWREGYLTLSRKYGKYLPAPPKVGGYEVDAISKFKNKYAIGIFLNENEFDDENFLNKVNSILRFKDFNSQNKVTLFIGVPSKLLLKATILISSLEIEKQKSIKIISLQENYTNN
ncbi:MAG: hypothetical protein N2321_04160 [Melioribacteraceae bacterium]|nr:hypothetical protein [Melioribacteraceae bacterium]